MPDPHIVVEERDSICHIRIERPQRRNALTVSMYSALVDTLREADANPAIRAIVLTGTNDIFTGGNDLADFMESPPTGHDSPVFQFLLTLIDADTPLVAVIRGPAIGIGTTMLLHFDLVFCDEAAVFEMPFTKLALCPEGGSSLLLPQLCGLRRASELLLLSERFGAAIAKEVGLVNHVFSGERLEPEALARVERLVSMPPESVRLARRLMREPFRAQVKAAMDREGEQFIARLHSEEAREAFTAFFEKRAPDFSRFT
ncbi:MAG: enoyl-CoA hydratase [Deltaproteobacteria bacterium]|nr:MAG: enoyl-CoA hydratase [Deltaproteobacteria bacterium]